MMMKQRLNPGVRTFTALRLLSALMLSAAWWVAAPCPPVHAQGEAAAAQATPKQSSKDRPGRLTFDLGSFEIREVRPTRNETTNVNFTAYFAMAPGVSMADVQQLEHWKHRLRDQVIIAVRTAQDIDFQEPDLVRLRHIILFRMRRLLKADVVQDILLSEFTFKME
jgi:hypothetical protein